jgi:hypothetical protein
VGLESPQAVFAPHNRNRRALPRRIMRRPTCAMYMAAAPGSAAPSPDTKHLSLDEKTSPSRPPAPTRSKPHLLPHSLASASCPPPAHSAECIKTKGTFCICVPGGSIVKALSKLDKTAMDFTKVEPAHIIIATQTPKPLTPHPSSLIPHPSSHNSLFLNLNLSSLIPQPSNLNPQT